jgi:hypothetical protein
MRVKDLKPNKRNPRRISGERLMRLGKSLDKYGDLGCVVRNVESGTLVGGHQRSRVIPSDAKVTYTQKYTEPTRTGTIAEGYIEWNGERFGYREVKWDARTEAEAMLAANNHGGETDKDLLAILKADFKDMDLQLAGLEIAAPVLPTIRVDLPVQSAEGPVAEEESDEQYAARTSGTGEERVATVAEELNAGAAFEEVKEDTESKNSRHIVIIYCTTKEHKEEIREALRSVELIKERGARIF